MIIFDGLALAAAKETAVKTQVAQLAVQGKHITIAAVLFTEDQGSVLYTRLKHEAAKRVGITYRVQNFSLRTEIAEVSRYIRALSADPSITGIITQKPWRHSWEAITGVTSEEGKAAFQAWWQSLVTQIDPAKDVDELNHGPVLPATCQAVLDIAEAAQVLKPD